jgi:hypothetical protein
VERVGKVSTIREREPEATVTALHPSRDKNNPASSIGPSLAVSRAAKSRE